MAERLAPDERDRRIEVLERDLATLRSLLQEYILQREHDEEILRASEEALRASEERYRSLIQRAAYGIYRSTPEGRFLEVNPALVAMLGYDSAEELLGVDIARGVYRDHGERTRRIAAWTRDDPDWSEVEWQRKDGTPITVRLSARAVRDEFGAVEYFEVIAENVSERHRREEILRRSERMASLGTTLAGAAHELNNPLAAISGFAQLLLRGSHDEDDRAAIEMINHEAKRAARIVRDLLTLARTEGAERRTPVDLNAIVRYIIGTRRYAMETRGIAAHLELAEPLAPVLADRTQMEQVVLNLVVNAEQAMQAASDAPPPRAEGGALEPRHEARLTVRTFPRGDGVVLEIVDTGAGIPASELPRIWDPFWTTKPEGEGTGLGLSVAHGIVTAHGGTIEVESAVGAGATFTVTLPAYTRVSDSAADEATIAALSGNGAAVSPRATTPLDILIVDDEVSILRFLERYLTSRGHAVLTARDGAQAIRLAERLPFDVVVCDMRMPGLDGGEIIRRLRDLPHLERTRYLVSTGDDASPAARAKIEALPVAAVVAKPYNVEELRRAVEGP